MITHHDGLIRIGILNLERRQRAIDRLGLIIRQRRDIIGIRFGLRQPAQIAARPLWRAITQQIPPAPAHHQLGVMQDIIALLEANKAEVGTAIRLLMRKYKPPAE